MRVCHVTTFWPNRYGFTHYLDALIKGMRANRPEKHFIAAEGDTLRADTEEYECVPCFRRDDDYVDGLARTILSFEPDIVIFQYGDDVFGMDERFVRLLDRLNEEAVPTIVNQHSIFPPHWKCKFGAWRTTGAFDREVARLASRVWVHSNVMKRHLYLRGVPEEKVVVIPHGTPIERPLDAVECKKRLGIQPDAPTVLFFGFIWHGKGLDFLLRAFKRLVARVPNAVLYVGGYVRYKKPHYMLYQKYIEGLVKLLGLSSNVRFWGDYVPDEMAPVMLSAADLVAMPYRQDYSSVSGVVHQTAGMGKLMLCSRIYKFLEVGENISQSLLVRSGDLEGWAEAMERLLLDEKKAQALKKKTRAWARSTSWENVGRMVLRVCDELAAETPRCGSAMAAG